MKIVCIGAGNLATHLAIALHRIGHQLLQVFSRTEVSASQLAEQVEAQAITHIADVRTDADLYLFSVKDAVLPELLAAMPICKGIWVHTAGSIPMAVFAPFTENYGVFYPLQTFSKNRPVDFISLPFFIEGSSSNIETQLYDLAKQLSSRVTILDSARRRYLHLSAVFACNFTNHMYVLADKLLREQAIDPEVLLPLIDETAAKIHDLSPLEAQTGPAVRYDLNVIDKHLELLQDERLRTLYSQISKSIHIEAINRGE